MTFLLGLAIGYILCLVISTFFDKEKGEKWTSSPSPKSPEGQKISHS
jgi:hypothetical protein